MSLDINNIYSITFIIVFSITVHYFLNSFNSKETIILKKKKRKIENYNNMKISDILNNKNVKCNKKDKILKEEFINYKKNEEAYDIIKKEIDRNKKNNVYFIRPVKQYKDITSQEFYDETFIYPINPMDKKEEIVGIDSKEIINTVDDMDKFKMSNNYYTY
jgi:hypothetical protein